MLYAVTVQQLNSIFFLIERPTDGPWEVEEDVTLDIPSNYADWPEGAERPAPILCVSISNPKSYKMFTRSRDVDSEQYKAAELNFGGVYSPFSWKRYLKSLRDAMPFLEIPDDEPIAARDAAISAVKREA